MNRLFFAVIFLSLAVGLCAYEQSTVTDTFEGISTILDELYADPSNQDYEKISDECKKIEDLWKKEETPLAAMTDHSGISETEDALFALKPLADSESDDLYPAIENAKQAIKRFYEHSRVTLGNVF